MNRAAQLVRGAILSAALFVTVAAEAAATPPSVQAPSAAVIEASTGTVLYEKNANTARPMASTTKLMTALVALDQAPLSTRYSAVDYGGSPLETRINLRPGERMTLADLVRAMMLPSANDAAQTLAVSQAGSRAAFVKLMNERAEELGLKRTRFTNPVGLDSGNQHRTTALELAKIGVAAHENPFLQATAKRTSITLKSGDQPRTIINRNRVLGTPVSGGGKIDGLKTGHTSGAGYALVGSATSRGVTVVSVVLGGASESSRDGDTARLLKWAGGLMQRKTLAKEGQPLSTVPVKAGKQESVAIEVAEDFVRAVPSETGFSLKPEALPAELEAPVAKGTKLGYASVMVGKREVGRVPLQTATAVERQGTVAAIGDWISTHWGALIAALLIISGTLLLVTAALQRRSPRTRVPESGDPPASSPAP